MFPVSPPPLHANPGFDDDSHSLHRASAWTFHTFLVLLSFLPIYRSLLFRQISKQNFIICNSIYMVSLNILPSDNPALAIPLDYFLV